MKKKLFVAGLTLVVAGPAAAQQVTLSGQIRPRYEFRDPAEDGKADEFISMRIRAGIEAVLASDVSVTLEFQDVRFWGEERDPLGDFRADNLDLHQGFVTVARLGGGNAWARVGRQRAPLGNERLIGAVDWAQQGQSFDGVRLGTSGTWGSASTIAFKIAEETSGLADDVWLVGGLATLGAGDGELDLFGFYERVRGSVAGNEGTVGARYALSGERNEASIEGAIQFGTRTGRDVSAFMIGASAGRQLTQQLEVTLWWDYLSGDGDPSDDTQGVFSTLYGTNHAYYGYADLFMNIPVHTGGRGLQDLAVKTTWTGSERLSVDVDLHAFRMADKGTLSVGRLGEELDITMNWTMRPGVALAAGFSQVFQADGLAAIGQLSKNMSFAYAMLNVAF